METFFEDVKGSTATGAEHLRVSAVLLEDFAFIILHLKKNQQTTQDTFFYDT